MDTQLWRNHGLQFIKVRVFMPLLKLLGIGKPDQLFFRMLVSPDYSGERQ